LFGNYYQIWRWNGVLRAFPSAYAVAAERFLRSLQRRLSWLFCRIVGRKKMAHDFFRVIFLF